MSNKYLEKIATKLVLYEDPATKQRKWIAGNNPPPKGYNVVASTYKKAGKKRSSTYTKNTLGTRNQTFTKQSLR